MINIISTQPRAREVHGPYKVYANLLKGLDSIGYPYLVNADLNATKRLWVHDDKAALQFLRRSRAYKVLGPNIVSLPTQLPSLEFDNTIYVLPSEWPVQLWRQMGFNACPLIPWPVGIDTDEFHPSRTPKWERRVMVYHKGRRVSELITILDVLYALRLRYSLVIYGRYGEEEYREFLNKSSFVIWHGVSETQGIAMQEAMACSIPILVCDVSTLGDDAEGSAYPDKLKALPVTAAPYFDKTCGIRITNLVDLKDAVCSLLDEIDDYRPREYVLEHLSLERQASRFVQLWETWGLGVDKGYGERPATLKPFTEPTSARVQRLAYKAMRELFPPSDERNG